MVFLDRMDNVNGFSSLTVFEALPKTSGLANICLRSLLIHAYLVVPAKTPQCRRRNGLQLKLLARNSQEDHNFDVICVSFWG